MILAGKKEIQTNDQKNCIFIIHKEFHNFVFCFFFQFTHHYILYKPFEDPLNIRDDPSVHVIIFYYAIKEI